MTILIFFVSFIVIVAVLFYILGYGYIFNGISKTYLKGKTSANIDDGKLFSSNLIHTESPRLWEEDPDYNSKELPKNIVEDLINSNTASFIVIKNGKLIHEQYWNGYDQLSKTNSFSMAKAVTVMLLGKALEEGKIKNIDDQFSDYFEEFKNKEFAGNLTLKNLAQMESGLDWSEDYKNPFLPNARAYYGKSLLKSTLSRNFKENPGEKFEYQSGFYAIFKFCDTKSGQSIFGRLFI
ncbi:hypothetical protein J3D55_000643 [Chryseobacterium ginsenosidimutans]|uniref:serine hydrolase domain-containing protein n=1 Tax=Chryseobacterium ginsenosidimutans TaxID=687846 RepID=UPI0021684302|nr:serine hydrolase [Chryseobacterium ginsenosidimutans]MCS3867727.1 hypothetical protein [Chryseobacterium ginsenosidimutans]